MTDARFEDGADQPLRLIAQDAGDVEIVSSLLQDAVFPVSEIRWARSRREFALLLNRFRWEDRPAAELGKRPYERVQSLLLVKDVLAVASQGIDRGSEDLVLSLLSLAFTPGEDAGGTLELVLAGDGALRCTVECVDIVLQDVTRPYLAPSGKAPDHPE